MELAAKLTVYTGLPDWPLPAPLIVPVFVLKVMLPSEAVANVSVGTVEITACDSPEIWSGVATMSSTSSARSPVQVSEVNAPNVFGRMNVWNPESRFSMNEGVAVTVEPLAVVPVNVGAG